MILIVVNQIDIKKMKNFVKKCLPVREKVVLLHPLSEGTRGERRGVSGKRKFFESLRPAQDQRRGDASRGKEPITKEHQREHQGGTRDSEKNKSKTIVQRRV